MHQSSEWELWAPRHGRRGTPILAAQLTEVPNNGMRAGALGPTRIGDGRGGCNDGCHGGAMNRQRVDPASGGSEWWYWHITTEQFSVTLAVHTTNLLGGAAESPYLSVTLACGANDLRRDRLIFSAGDLKWTDRGHLILSDKIIESDRGWEMSLPPGDWEHAGAVEKVTRGWRIYDSLLAKDSVGHEMHWSVPMPRGKWSGKLILSDDSTLSGPGFAYQDHNWADSPLSDLVYGWSWYSLSDAQSTFIWANVESPFHASDVVSVRIRQLGPLSRRWTPRTPQMPLTQKTLSL